MYEVLALIGIILSIVVNSFTIVTKIKGSHKKEKTEGSQDDPLKP